MSETRKILCTACNVRADAVVTNGVLNKIRCPKCGREADYKEASFAAAAFLMRSGMSLSNTRSKYITIKRSPNPKPDFVFEESN